MLYDCFTFFNELELLELRLNLLNNVVDYFVVVESNKTFTNKNKDFIFERNKERFADFLKKIIYIKVEDMPKSNNAWDLEYHQRNSILRGLTDCDEDDLIIISDIDEIPDPKTISLLLANKSKVDLFIDKRLEKKIITAIKYLRIISRNKVGVNCLDATPFSFEQKLYYYFVNCQSKKTWNGSIITKFKKLDMPQKLRDQRNRLPRLKNGGWHFSYLGGTEKIILKINSFAETQTNTPKTNSRDYINSCINSGLDIYERKGEEFEYEFINLNRDELPKELFLLIKKYPYLYFDKKQR